MVSVIITTKDRVEFLKRAVKSVVDNDKKPDEIIIVNDGGATIDLSMLNIDDSAEIDFTIINHSKSLGGNVARNKGAEVSKGEFLFFLDDDDAYTHDSIRTRLEQFNNQDVGLVYTGKKFVYSDDLTSIVRENQPKHKGSCFESLLKLGNIIGSTSCVSVRRKCFIEAGMFDEKLKASQDYDLWIRIARLSLVAHNNASSLLYTIHKSNTQISGNYMKYLEVSDYLANKYAASLTSLNLYDSFLAARFLRVSLAASRKKPLIRFKYAVKSFVKRPSLKAAFMLLPVSITSYFYKLS